MKEYKSLYGRRQLMNYQKLLIDNLEYKTSNVARYVQGISVKETKFNKI